MAICWNSAMTEKTYRRNTRRLPFVWTKWLTKRSTKSAYNNIFLKLLQNLSSRIYVAILCLCKEKICISKCCPKGSYYNVIVGSCKKESEDRIESYKPDFLEGSSYQLVYNVPECDGPDMMIANENDTSPISILGNGHLMTLSNGKGVFDRKK